jgi:hypothetical protein
MIVHDGLQGLIYHVASCRQKAERERERERERETHERAKTRNRFDSQRAFENSLSE